MNILHEITRSSSDPKKLGMTVRGILVGLIPVVTTFSSYYGLQGVDHAFLMPIIDQTVDTLNLVFTAVSALLVTGGMLRKAYNTFKK